MLRIGWRLLGLVLLGAAFSALPLYAADNGAEGPAAEGLNVTFAVEGQWVMYGAPQDKKVTREEFEALAEQIKETRFIYPVVQIVVILRNADAEGTLGLIDKRGRKMSTAFVEAEGTSIYGVWHEVGYSTSPERMLAEHQENVLAAEEKYADLPVLFLGAVRRVAKDSKGDVYVDFSIRHTDSSLSCYPWEGAPQGISLKNLKAGDRLKVSGQFTEWSAEEGLKLRGCLFSRPR